MIHNVHQGVDAHLQETFVSREELLQGDFLKVLRDTIKLPNGKTATREFVVHPGAVMVIPLLDDGRLVMERQFRYPLQQVMLEFPAGKLDAGESVWRCARRELLEETGYRATDWARAGQLHPVISYSTEFIDIWFARGLTLGERQLDDGEFLDVVLVTSADLVHACFDGRVTDAKTLAGALWLQNVQSGAWQLTWQSVGKSIELFAEAVASPIIQL